MPEYQHYLDEIEGLKRSLSLSEITQEEYNKKVNEAKGALLAAADAAKIGGSEINASELNSATIHGGLQ